MVKRWSAAALALLLMGSVAACGEDDESAAEKAGDAIEQAGEDAEDAAEEAGDAVEDATD
jgi:hypothetical protein